MSDESDDGRLLYEAWRVAGINAGWIPSAAWDTLLPFQVDVWVEAARHFRAGVVPAESPHSPPAYRPPDPLTRQGPRIDPQFWPGTLPINPPPPDPEVTPQGVEPSPLAKVEPRPYSEPLDPPPMKWT